jgi:ribonuclease HI
MVKMIEVKFDSSSIEKPLKLLSYSFVIYKDKNKIYEEYGITNEKDAEFYALYKALEWIIKQNFKNEEIIVKSDAERIILKCLRIQQHKLNEESSLEKLISKIEEFNNISFITIPRKLNYEAHFLAIKAIKEYCKNKRIKIF